MSGAAAQRRHPRPRCFSRGCEAGRDSLHFVGVPGRGNRWSCARHWLAVATHARHNPKGRKRRNRARRRPTPGQHS